LSGEALRESGAKENISPAIVREIAERIREVKALGVQTVGCDRRRKHLARAWRGAPRNGPHHRRLHGHACDRDQRPGLEKRA